MVAAGVVVAVAGIAHHYRRPRRPSTLRLLALLGLASPWAWWDSVLGFFGDVAGRVKDFVINLVNQALDVVRSWADDLWHGIDAVWRWGNDLVRSIDNVVTDIYNFANRIVTHDIPNWFNSAMDWARRAIDDVYGWIRRELDHVYQWASDAFNNAIHFARDIVDQLGRWASDALHQLGQWATDLFHAAEDLARTLWDDIKRGFDAFIRDVFTPIYDFFHGPLMDAYHLLRAVWRWLEWLATQSFDLVRSAIEFLAHTAEGDIVGYITREIGQEAGPLADSMASWLG